MEEKLMKIEIKKNESEIKLKVDGIELNFDYESVNKIIDLMVERKENEVIIETSDELENYKLFFDKLNEEVHVEDFMKVYDLVNSTKYSQEEIRNIILSEIEKKVAKISKTTLLEKIVLCLLIASVFNFYILSNDKM